MNSNCRSRAIPRVLTGSGACSRRVTSSIEASAEAMLARCIRTPGPRRAGVGCVANCAAQCSGDGLAFRDGGEPGGMHGECATGGGVEAAGDECLGAVEHAPPFWAAGPDREHNVVAVNADALVRLTRAIPPAISPTPARDFPSRVRSPRQQSRLAVGAQFVMVTGLTYRSPVQSMLLSRNRFTKYLMDSRYYPSISLLLLTRYQAGCWYQDGCWLGVTCDGTSA